MTKLFGTYQIFISISKNFKTITKNKNQTKIFKYHRVILSLDNFQKWSENFEI